MLSKCQPLARNHKFLFKNPLCSIDNTVIDYVSISLNELSGLSRKFGDVFYAERAKSSDCFDSFLNFFDKSSRVNFHPKGFAIFS